MPRSFQKLDQLPTVCMVGEGYTEEAFLRAFKRKVRSESGPQPLPLVSIFTIGTGGGDPITAIRRANHKIFRDNHSHRRVLFIDTENKQVLPQHEEFAREYGIELCWSKPCIERHLLQMYGFTLSSGMSVDHYKSELKKKPIM